MAIMTPYSATASQKMTLIKLSDQIRGTRTAAPIRLAPINRMPHDAPTTDMPMQRKEPMDVYVYGFIFLKARTSFTKKPSSSFSFSFPFSPCARAARAANRRRLEHTSNGLICHNCSVRRGRTVDGGILERHTTTRRTT